MLGFTVAVLQKCDISHGSERVKFTYILMTSYLFVVCKISVNCELQIKVEEADVAVVFWKGKGISRKQ